MQNIDDPKIIAFTWRVILNINIKGKYTYVKYIQIQMPMIIYFAELKYEIFATLE
jgi:hypothetical protein